MGMSQAKGNRETETELNKLAEHFKADADHLPRENI